MLENQLSDTHDVDGHDSGSGQLNIFVHTVNPLQLLAEADQVVHQSPMRNEVRSHSGRSTELSIRF